MPFFKPADDSEEMKYLRERREELGGYVPARKKPTEVLEIPQLEIFSKVLKSDAKKGPSTTSTTGVLGAGIISTLLKDKSIGKRIVPIIPDEARTFGMEGLFTQCGIYASKGQLYEPVDSGTMMFYKEAKNGQLLEEGINEAGAMSSFVAAGTSHANLGLHMIPFYVYYSMFGFQRVGDLIWLAADSRCRGFLCGGTSGRTTLNGEGLQHEDGHSHLIATTVPNLQSYDPAYGYELAVIVQDGLRRMYGEGEDVFYYLSVYNEEYVQPDMPEGVEDGIINGMYKLSSKEVDGAVGRVQLFGSGTILREALRAQELLADEYKIASDVWSVTSYSQMARNAATVDRWNKFHPNDEAQTNYLDECLAEVEGPIISTSDNVRLVGDQIRPWVKQQYIVLGTDGFGRSDTRPALRRHFEVDAENVAYAALCGLANEGKYDKSKLPEALKALDIDPEKVNPLYA